MTLAAETAVPSSDVRRDVVAQALPATAAAPESIRRIGFLRGLLLFWLVPRRFGPHLAAASFRRAVTAHVISVLSALAIVAVTWLWIQGTRDLSVPGMRAWLATRILVLASESARSPFSWVPALLVVG